MRPTEAAQLVLSAYKWYRKSADQYSDGYLRLYHSAAESLTSRKELGRYITSKYLDSNQGRILEVASGTGLVSGELNNGNIISTDISLESLQILKKGTAVNSIVGAAFDNLPFVDGIFSTVINVGGYRYVQDPKRYWSEMKRVIMPGGRVIIAQFHPRISQIKGRNLFDENEFNNHSFSCTQKDEFFSHVDLGNGKLEINTGCYEIFVFTRL